MDKKVENVKKYITSLLTASPLAMTMIQLNKDYRNTIGEPIPYQKLGYNSLEHFLRSIPDTVRVRGQGPMSEILPVLSEKSIHVMDMVSSQKKPTPKRRDGYHCARTVVMPPMVNRKPPTQPQPRPIEKPQKIYYPKPSNVTSTPAPSNMSSVNSKPANTNYNAPTRIPTVDQIPKQEYHNNSSCSSSSKGRINNILLPPLMSINPQELRQETIINSHKPTDNHGATNGVKREESNETESRNSFRSTRKKSYLVDKVKPPTENLEERVPSIIRDNLKKLISLHPEGIWCAKIPEEYRKMFRADLRYHELGFNNLIDLCLVLESVFHYVRPSSDDFKLYDRSKPLPNCAEQKYTVASYGENKSTDVDVNKALPPVDWNDMMTFLPPGTFLPGREIPRAFVSDDTKKNDCIDVVVGEIYDLSKFWVYQDVDGLNKLMDDMQSFYKNNYLEYFMTKQLIREGVYCVQIIFGEYHRALIVDLALLDEDKIRVVFIDYGTMAKVTIKDLCFLHEQFAYLPAQAIRCRLASICPPVEGTPWSKESSRTFRNLIKRRKLTAKIDQINWEQEFIEVFLADTTEENNVFYINDRLVELGFAVHCEKGQKKSIVDSISKPIVNFIHLFPTFKELEHGLAPSTGEMEILHDCNIPINFCYPQYFTTNTTEEEKIIQHAVAFHEKHCLKGVREFSLHLRQCIDRSKKNQGLLNLSIFGSLESEMREFLKAKGKDEPSAEEEFSDAVEEPACGNAKKDLERLDILKNKTVDDVRKDRLLSEDIMNEILSISKGLHLENFDDVPGTINEDLEDSLHELHIESDVNYDLKVVEAELRLPDISPDVSHDAEVLKDIQSNLEKRDTNAYLNTNPFLSELTSAAEEAPSSSLPTLNPNNPFLSYLMKQKDDAESDCSDKSSGSTVYGTYVDEVAVEQKWSTEDVSDILSVSSYSTVDSLQRLSNGNGAVVATTVEEVARPAMLLPPATPYCSPYPMPYGYPDWTVGFNNPYYRARFTNYGYHQQSFYPPMGPPISRFGFGVQGANSQPRPAICPPPGFGPQLNARFHEQPRPPGLFEIQPNMAAGQYNCVSRTSVSNVSVTSDRDFYEMYNERLQQVHGNARE